MGRRCDSPPSPHNVLGCLGVPHRLPTVRPLVCVLALDRAGTYATHRPEQSAVKILLHVLSAPLSDSLFLGRHEDHQTGCRLTDVLGGPTEHNIQQASFTMTAQDQQIGL